MTKILTAFNDAIRNYQDKLDENEQRGSKYTLLDKVKNQYSLPQNSIIPEAARRDIQEQGFCNTIKVPVIDHYAGTYEELAVTSCNTTPTDITTDLVTIGTTPRKFTVTMNNRDSECNYVGDDATFQSQLMGGLQSSWAAIDASILAAVESSLNQLYPASTFPFPEVANAFQVSQVDLPTMYNSVSTIMDIMDWDLLSNNMDVFANPTHLGSVRFNNAQGISNDTNLTFQFGDNYKFHSNKAVVNSAGTVQSTAYVIKPNSIYFTEVMDPLALKNAESDGGGIQWSTVTDPMGLKWSVRYKSVCVDNSIQESWEYYMDSVIATMYNSDIANRYNPYNKFEVLTT